MHPATEQKLASWRDEIAETLAGLLEKLPAARQAIVEAERALDEARRASNDLHAAVAAGVGRSPISNEIAARLAREEIPNETAAGPVRARTELAQLEDRIADCKDALRQIDQAAAGSWPAKLLGPQPPQVIKRPKPEPVVIENIEMPHAAAQADAA